MLTQKLSSNLPSKPIINPQPSQNNQVPINQQVSSIEADVCDELIDKRLIAGKLVIQRYQVETRHMILFTLVQHQWCCCREQIHAEGNDDVGCPETSPPHQTPCIPMWQWFLNVSRSGPAENQSFEFTHTQTSSSPSIHALTSFFFLLGEEPVPLAKAHTSVLLCSLWYTYPPAEKKLPSHNMATAPLSLSLWAKKLAHTLPSSSSALTVHVHRNKQISSRSLATPHYLVLRGVRHEDGVE